ncbi:OMH1 [Hepatospora eriocheir]|uniref:OMH1 n=1 Tax=Hepatospora eriocheir TaxID=1081669 RepID=A0A1X0QB52_9MICR|nr:OMH1 [Hepatospora eriocheir]
MNILILVRLIFSRQNAVIMILCRNREKDAIANTLRNFEEKFNKNYNYPYVFLNDDDFTDEFKKEIQKITSNVKFGKVEKEDWEMPDNIDRVKAMKNWKLMETKGVPYANLESYHNMCRFFSRTFYKHKLLLEYDYYWRIEPGVKFHCDIDFDPFDELKFKNKKYAFVITIREFMDSIPSLMDVTLDFLKENYTKIPKYNSHKFMFDNGKYNGCHFWSNFEIADFNFFRSKLYNAYLDHLENSGGFYYERWGDAPVHSLAVALFLDLSHILFIKKIGYTHDSFTHCPEEGKNCDCDVKKSVDFTPFSCLKEYLRV